MATLARPTVNLSLVTEILEIAHKLLRHNRDHNLVQKIMVLQAHAELKGMNPDRTYDERIRQAFDQLTARVHLNG